MVGAMGLVVAGQAVFDFVDDSRHVYSVGIDFRGEFRTVLMYVYQIDAPKDHELCLI